MWREVLGLDAVGVEDNFFELGGDSMHSIQIVAAARDRGLTFTPRDLFAHPTVAALATLAGLEAGTSPAVAPASVDADELAALREEFGDL